MANPHRIVVVEELFLARFLCTALRRMGYDAGSCMSEQVCELMESGQVDLLVTNTPAAFAAFGSVVPLLYTAAFPDAAQAAGFRRWLPLRKPFQNAELVSAVRSLLSKG
nr:response regulator receiver protein [uncultured bacterium]